ncbi:MAG TPA: hypothetical protein VHX44_15955, partial [Planctomycetota bacterium]|nr:hypothetical protein [Planctomycetota bacterium]
WDPRAWSRWLGEGTQNVPGDSANTIEHVCDTTKPADSSCAYGKDRVASTGDLGLFKAQPAAGAAFPSRFTVIAHVPADVDEAALVALASDAGLTCLPGAVVPLHGTVVLHGVAVTQGWRFPALRRQGHLFATEPVNFTTSKPLLEGELILEICLDNRDVPTKPVGGCDHMPDKDGVIGGFAGETGTKYEGAALKAFAVGGERALALQQNTFMGVFPGTVDAVAVDLDPVKGITLLSALGADGSLLGQARTEGTGRQWLRVSAPGIARMTLKAESPAIVFEVCWGQNRMGAISQLIHLQTATLPVVVATHADGKVFQLTGTLVTQPATPALLAVRTCPKLRYVLPKDPGGSGWTHVQVAPWVRGDVALVALCGVTLEAAAAQQADTTYRGAWKDLLTDLVQAAVNDEPTHQVYLDANQTYEIRASWQWQGFKPSHPGEEPSPTSSGTWTNASTQDRFRFRTADFGLAAAPAPVQDTSLDVDPAQGGPGYDERTFDPRGVSRYVTQVQPDHESPPHFLDDHVGFWFQVDHLEALIEKYGRLLQVKVLHTRPDVGSLHATPPHVAGTKHVLDVTTSTTWSIDTLAWYPADYRLSQASLAAPCIGGAPALGSSSVSVTADLQPSSEYDLLLNAAPSVVNANPEVAIARSHFRTSRYRNPTEMLRALGLAPTMGLMAPNDAIATSTLPATALKIGDSELDAALTTVGLDPWPLPAGPRTTAVWLRPALATQPWKLIGILLEGDEPIYRDGFKTGAIGEPMPPPRLAVQTLKLYKTKDVKKKGFGLPGPIAHTTTVTTRTLLGTFTERVRNASGTRSFFTATSPIAVTGGRLYDLELHFQENGLAGAMGRMPIYDRPLIVAQEGE